jgi:dihydrofolate synthase/folylpolyglutamate synthase
VDLRAVLADLEARKPERVKPSLDRIRALSDLMDHPERTYRTLHVTGTNGKTTTARLAARILCGQGVTTGLYTSPHLVSVTERLALCDQPIGGEEMAAAYAHLKPYLDEVDGRGDPLSYFETLTGLAFLWMADKPVDVGVFEVGMGGTWDATNLVNGEVAVFTSIGLDHPELGSTVAEVAGEKAGIIKPAAVVIVQDPQPEVMAAIEPRARDLEAVVRALDRDWLVDRVPAVGGQSISVETPHQDYPALFLPLHGAHQALNAAAAVVAGEAVLQDDLDREALRVSLAGATSPGRLEVVGREPLVVLDGAHNPHAALRLAEALPEAFTWRRLHLVIGVLRDKDLEGIVDALSVPADVVYACPNSSPRSRPAAEVAAAAARAGLPATEHPSPGAALDAAVAAAAEDDLILATGSLYTVADILSTKD